MGTIPGATICKSLSYLLTTKILSIPPKQSNFPIKSPRYPLSITPTLFASLNGVPDKLDRGNIKNPVLKTFPFSQTMRAEERTKKLILFTLCPEH